MEDSHKRMKNDLEKSEFKDFIIGLAKSQHAIDTQIGRLGGEFPKNERPEEIHELERKDYRDSGELAEMSQGGNPVNMDAQPIIKAEKNRRKKARPLEVELDLSGKSHGKYAQVGFGRSKGISYNSGCEF